MIPPFLFLLCVRVVFPAKSLERNYSR